MLAPASCHWWVMVSWSACTSQQAQGVWWQLPREEQWLSGE